jgi:hypothetical protein
MRAERLDLDDWLRRTFAPIIPGELAERSFHSRRSPILTAALMAKYPSCEIGAYYAIMRDLQIMVMQNHAYAFAFGRQSGDQRLGGRSRCSTTTATGLTTNPPEGLRLSSALPCSPCADIRIRGRR